MSTSRGDLEQKFSIDLDPLVGLLRPSPCSSSGEQLGDDIEQSLPTPHDEESDEEEGWKGDLLNAVCGNKWNKAKEIIDQNSDASTAQISERGKTALHVAALLGHVTIVEELLKLLPREFIRTLDSNGDTALTLASWYSGITQVAKCLVHKNSDILHIPDALNHLPVITAFRYGHHEMGRYLYSVTPLEHLEGRWGSQLLRYCFREQCFDIALNLLHRCEELLLVHADDEGWTLVHDIATLNTAILSPSELVFWKRWVYNYINIPSTTAIDDVYVDIQQEERNQGDKAKLTEPGHCLLQRLINFMDNFAEVKKIQELKLLHAQANEFLPLVCKNARKAYRKISLKGPLLRAAREGNVEFVFQVSKAVPEIILSQTLVLCFVEALNYRQAGVFNLIHGLRPKYSLFTAAIVDESISILSKAAIKAPDHVLNRIYAPTLQMQRELQWFKEVESLMPRSFWEFRDDHGVTPRELFRENHKKLMKQGEEWIKATASSCSVVGTLIVTIMFAAAFTVPGGNDQNIGYPLLIKQPFFQVFMFSTILSLLSSSTSVLMFLAILTSQYSEEKFLKSLPSKLIWGLSFLFISIATMMIAFLSTIHLMLKHAYSWGVLPIIILASVPIFFFVLSEFPLLLHTYISTYGNIFDRKVEPWP